MERVQGFVDPRLKFTINLFGPPAKGIKDFRPTSKETVLGVSLVVSVPFGQYDKKKIINIGGQSLGLLSRR